MNEYGCQWSGGREESKARKDGRREVASSPFPQLSVVKRLLELSHLSRQESSYTVEGSGWFFLICEEVRPQEEKEVRTEREPKKEGRRKEREERR